MEGRKIPSELMSSSVENSTRPLAPNLVHLVSQKTADGYYYIPKDYLHTEPTKNINSGGIKEIGTWDKTHIFVPIVSFDGYNVLLYNNLIPDVLKAFKSKNNEYVYKAQVNCQTHHFIDSYSIEDVEVEKLTEAGFQQYKAALIASEMYEKLIEL